MAKGSRYVTRGSVLLYSSTHGLGSSVMDGGYGEEEKRKGRVVHKHMDRTEGFSLVPPLSWIFWIFFFWGCASLLLLSFRESYRFEM